MQKCNSHQGEALITPIKESAFNEKIINMSSTVAQPDKVKQMNKTNQIKTYYSLNKSVEEGPKHSLPIR